MKTLKKLNHIFDKSTKTKLSLLLIAIIVGGLIETASLALIYPLLDMLMSYSMDSGNTYINWLINLIGFTSISSLLAFLSFSLAVVYLFRSIYFFLLERTKIRFVSRLQASYSKRLLGKLINFSYLYHTHKNIAEIQNLIASDAGELSRMMTAILYFLADLFMAVFMMAYLFYESPVMTACAFVLILFCVCIYFLVFRKAIRKAAKKSRSARIASNKAIYQAFAGIKEVKVSRREQYFERVYIIARDKLINAQNKINTLNVLPRLSLELICFGGAFVLMGVFILGGTDISAVVPQLALFVLAAFKILPAVTKQVVGVNTILTTRPSVNSIYHSLYEEKDIAAEVPSDEGWADAAVPLSKVAPFESAAPTSAKTAADNTQPSEINNNGIEIRNLSFKYPRAEESVLDNVSFVIPENKSVAFVGTTGTGKTTMADLILGVLTPDKGTILYKGQPIYNNDLWRRSIGYIPQFIYLLDESILANVAFGIDPKEIDEDKVWRALEQAQLKAFVETLPEGIHTVIGDRGIRLSGGQRQRVGIARALYEDPPFLALDEATSSLDDETEAAVMEAIMGFHGNKTVLIVAHRLSTIKHCDIVYRVEDKKIIRER